VQGLAVSFCILLSVDSSIAFSVPSARQERSPLKSWNPTSTNPLIPLRSPLDQRQRFSPNGHGNIDNANTRLYMYNLPPSGGGGGGKGNEIGEIVKGAISIFLVVAFLASPLGALVFGLFNSFLVLLFVLPLVATVGFQIWQSINTVSGACPNCGAPVTVMKTSKDGESTPSLCFNCGAVLQSNYDNTAIENISGRRTIDDISSEMGGGSSIFDLFSSSTRTTTATTTTTTTNPLDGKDRKRREGTIIDVDVLDEEQPFQ
jgi:predicted RNA-binding Zn-ribbon protein involved in translation (DUF1610 family)